MKARLRPERTKPAELQNFPQKTIAENVTEVKVPMLPWYETGMISIILNSFIIGYIQCHIYIE